MFSLDSVQPLADARILYWFQKACTYCLLIYIVAVLGAITKRTWSLQRKDTLCRTRKRLWWVLGLQYAMPTVLVLLAWPPDLRKFFSLSIPNAKHNPQVGDFQEDSKKTKPEHPSYSATCWKNCSCIQAYWSIIHTQICSSSNLWAQNSLPARSLASWSRSVHETEKNDLTRNKAECA